jgi:hypothetical protein
MEPATRQAIHLLLTADNSVSVCQRAKVMNILDGVPEVSLPADALPPGPMTIAAYARSRNVARSTIYDRFKELGISKGHRDFAKRLTRETVALLDSLRC